MAALFRAPLIWHALVRRRVVAALGSCALAAGVLAAGPVGAASDHSVDDVKLSLSGGFVHGSAWFKDLGPGGSRVHVWIDTYSGGDLTGSLGHRTGMSSCTNAGATCYTLLSTSLQTSPGECYVFRARSVRAGDMLQARSPSSSMLCT
jgi:hypothetical protein